MHYFQGMHFHSLSGALNYFCCKFTAFNLNLFLLWWLKSNTYFSILFFFSLPMSGHKLSNMMALCLALRSCLGSRLKETEHLECPGQGMTHSKQTLHKCSYSSHERWCVTIVCVFCSFFSSVCDITILRLFSGHKALWLILEASVWPSP